MNRFLQAMKSALPLLLCLMFCSVGAFAQGTIDTGAFTGNINAMTIIIRAVGAFAVFVGLIIAGVSFQGGNMVRAFVAFCGALVGAIVIGMAPTLVSVLTGQTIGV